MNEQLKNSIKNTYVERLRELIPQTVRDRLTEAELEPYAEILAELFDRFLQGLRIRVPAQTIGAGDFITNVGGEDYDLSGSTTLAEHSAEITYEEDGND